MPHDPLLLVTHARGDGKFDNAILSKEIPEAVEDYPGTTAHISMRSNTPGIRAEEHPPYGGEEIYDICITDEFHGTIDEDTAKSLLQYDPITRAGTQYRACCGNTDLNLWAMSDRELQLTYLTDLTVEKQDDELSLLESIENKERRDALQREDLQIQYGSYF